jgi:hypothetical protein
MWLDRGIGWLFPAGARPNPRCARARDAVSARAQLRRRAHHAPHERLDTAAPRPTPRSRRRSPTLRNRSRDQVRNNPYAKRAIAKLVSASIGTGIMARPPAPVAKGVEALVPAGDFEGQLDFYGLQALIGAHGVRVGRVPGAPDPRGRRYKGEVPLKLQVLEPDYIDSTQVGPRQRQLHHRRRRDRPAAAARRLLAVGQAPRRVGHLPDEPAEPARTTRSEISCTSTRRSGPASCAACRASPCR